MSIWENTILTGFIVPSLSFYSNNLKHCLPRGCDRFIPVPANQLLHQRYIHYTVQKASSNNSNQDYTSSPLGRLNETLKSADYAR